MTKVLEPLPYFKWFWRDWRANRKVQRLHHVARGLYRDLLDEQWSEGSLPNETTALADICGCPVEVMEEHWPSLESFFEQQDDGSFLNAKLEKQRTDEDTLRAKKARGGRASALAKLNKTKQDSTPVEDLLTSANQSLGSVTESHIAEQSRALAEQSTTEQDVDDSLETEDTDMNLKNFKTAMMTAGVDRGVKVSGYENTWANLKLLTTTYGSAAVINDFENFLDENPGSEYSKGVLIAYLYVAADRLNSETPALASAKDPEVVSLARELTYLSGGQIPFVDKQRIRLAEVLKEFSAAEITSAFSAWFAEQDLSDPKNVSFLPGKFVQIVDGLAYSARKRKEESDKSKVAREVAVQRIQAEAEAERLAAESFRRKEEKLFDPLADLMV